MALGSLRRDDGHHCRSGELRQTRDAGDGRSLHAKERNEHRIASTKVHIWQIVERQAGFHRPDDGFHAFGAGDDLRFAEARAAREHHPIKVGIALFAVKRAARGVHGNANGAGVKPNEMRAKPDHGPPRFALLKLLPFVLVMQRDVAADFSAGRVPEEAVFERGLQIGAEMSAGDGLAF